MKSREIDRLIETMAIRRAFWTVRVGGADGAGARVPMMAVIDIPIIVIAVITVISAMQ